MTGITITGGKVTGVVTSDGQLAADTVVVVAGCHPGDLLAPLGLDVPVRIGHVAAVQTTPVGIELKQVLGVANADLAGRQQVDGRLRFTAGGTAWPFALSDLASGYDAVQPLGNEIVTLLQRAARVVPAITEVRIARVWGGLLDMTPDALPGDRAGTGVRRIGRRGRLLQGMAPALAP